MKMISFIILITLLACTGIYADPGLIDTVRIDSVAGYPAQNVNLPIHLFNDEPLSGIELVFKYDPTYLTIDTFSFDGGHLEFIDEQSVVYTNLPGKVHLLIYDQFNWIPAGHSPICNLSFNITNFNGGQTFTVDTGSMLYAKTWFADTSAMPIYPYIVPGYITAHETPQSIDSVWVQNTSANAGQTVEINIFGYNSELLDTLQLAIGYSSSDIIFKDVLFTGTRADSAQSKQYTANSSLREILITLVYSQVNPLGPGTGLLARVRFDIKSTASSQVVIIDTASYLGTQRMEFSPATSTGKNTFTPFFISGNLTISAGTAVDDNDQILLPTEFSLKQNYPNPFNPVTTIEFDLPQSSWVSFDIFNILGEKVTTLIEGNLPAGHHRVVFNGDNSLNQPLASGVYFYRLNAGEYSQTRKMTLLK